MTKARRRTDPVKKRDNRNRNRGNGGQHSTLKSTPQMDPAVNTKNLDKELLLGLARLDCTVDEIADLMKCSTKHLQRYYRHIITEGRVKGKVSLRRFQFQAAERGNPAMLIWLGKQRLNQRDKIEATGADGGPLDLLIRVVKS